MMASYVWVAHVVLEDTVTVLFKCIVIDPCQCIKFEFCRAIFVKLFNSFCVCWSLRAMDAGGSKAV